MNWEEWAAAGIAAWFAVATVLALLIGAVLRWAGRDPDRSWLEQIDGEDHGEVPGDDAR